LVTLAVVGHELTLQRQTLEQLLQTLQQQLIALALVEQMLTISHTLLSICGSAQYDDARP